MSNLPPDRCGYTFPEEYSIGEYPNQQHCCWRETVTGAAKCIWHADPTDVDKTAQDFRAVLDRTETQQQISLRGAVLDGAKLSGVELGDSVSFANARLRQADFSGADLTKVALETLIPACVGPLLFYHLKYS